MGMLKSLKNSFLLLVYVGMLLGGYAVAKETPGDSLSIEKKENSKSESGILMFEREFSIRFLANYNYMNFWSSEYHNGALHSNRPVDIGLGFGYGDFSLDFKYSLPFTFNNGNSTTKGFDTGLDFFPGCWWLKLKYRKYSGFTTGSDDERDEAESDSSFQQKRFVDLHQEDFSFSALWIGSDEDSFSVRAAYFLDRIQKASAGSFIFGVRIQDATIEDRDSTLQFYSEKREIISSWLDMGYTYTWIYDQIFVNFWGVAGVALEHSNENNDDDNVLVFLPEVNGKMAVGQWRDKWSWNVVAQITYLPVIYNSHWEQRLNFSLEALIVRRF